MEKIIEIFNNLNPDNIIQIILAIGIMICFRIISSGISAIIIKILRPKTNEKRDVRKNPFYLPLKTIITFSGIYIAINMVKTALEIPEETIVILNKILKIMMILLVAKAFDEGLSSKHTIIKKLRNKSETEIDETTFKLTMRLIKIAIYIVAGFMVISELGYDISGFVTGLGIGGVVITLAAQDTAKSLIGGLAIFLDKPFKVGDYIQIGKYEGTVEDIKFRTTNIRTVDDAVLHIPNSEVSVTSIINLSEMNTRRYEVKLTLERECDLDKIQLVQKQIEDMLVKHEMVTPNSVHVNFQTITDNGNIIVVIAYIEETNYFKYIEIKEEINYKIMSILKNQDVKLAYNTQSVHIKRD